jgi:hypothetical protein
MFTSHEIPCLKDAVYLQSSPTTLHVLAGKMQSSCRYSYTCHVYKSVDWACVELLTYSPNILTPCWSQKLEIMYPTKIRTNNNQIPAYLCFSFPCCLPPEQHYNKFVYVASLRVFWWNEWNASMCHVVQKVSRRPLIVSDQVWAGAYTCENRADEVTVRPGFLRVCWFSPVTMIPPVLRTFIHLQSYPYSKDWGPSNRLILFRKSLGIKEENTSVVSTSNRYSCRDWLKVCSYALVPIHCHIQRALEPVQLSQGLLTLYLFYQSAVYHVEITSHRYFVNYRHCIYYVQRILMKLT